MTSSSFTRQRALGRSKAMMKELTGEIAAPGDQEVASAREGDKLPSDGSKGDELYRQIAAQYERECGRDPRIGDPGQKGWDLRSFDPEKAVERLIEVKGKGCPWVEDEVVELSRAQVHEALETESAMSSSRWYLYVIERVANGDYRVLPIKNPVRSGGSWILCGELWRLVAIDPRRITI